MVLHFGKYKVNAEPEKTREFYKTQELLLDGCDCQGCRNLEKAMADIPRPVKEFFAAFGIDPDKLFECFATRMNENGLGYMGACFAYGTVPEGDRGTDCDSGDEYNGYYPVTEDFQVRFSNSTIKIGDSPAEPAVRIEFSAVIPWVLDEEYTGPYVKE